MHTFSKHLSCAVRHLSGVMSRIQVDLGRLWESLQTSANIALVIKWTSEMDSTGPNTSKNMLKKFQVYILGVHNGLKVELPAQVAITLCGKIFFYHIYIYNII